MKRLSFMLIAGETSGDTLAAELVLALRQELALFQAQPTPDAQPLFASLEPRFFGAGGPRMAAAGVQLEVDMTAYTVFGFADVFSRLGQFVRLRNRLRNLAIARQPDVIICVDFSGFNRRLARAVRDHVRAQEGTFNDWRPRLVQFVSPQVWASRPGRARSMAEDLDLLLTIFPFEKAWYEERVHDLRVAFVGHPMLDRYAGMGPLKRKGQTGDVERKTTPLIVLLPGSRRKELKRHLPVMIEAAKLIQAKKPAVWRMVLPSDALAQAARAQLPDQPPIACQVGGLAETLAGADLALASSGTVTMECAYFGVPTVVLYRVSPPEFHLARRIVQIKHIAMPNLLAGETLFPEFIQHDATPEKLARAALDFLDDAARCDSVRARLAKVMDSLGGPGAARRAARAIVGLLAAPSPVVPKPTEGPSA